MVEMTKKSNLYYQASVISFLGKLLVFKNIELIIKCNKTCKSSAASFLLKLHDFETN